MIAATALLMLLAQPQHQADALEDSRPSYRGAAGLIGGGGVLLGGMLAVGFITTDATFLRDASHPDCGKWGIYCTSAKGTDWGTAGTVVAIVGGAMLVAGLVWLLVDVIIDKVITSRIEALRATSPGWRD